MGNSHHWQVLSYVAVAMSIIWFWTSQWLHNFSGEKSMLSSSSICHICKQDTKFKSESAFEFYLIKVWLPPLSITALSGARQALEDENVLVKGGSTISINVWVPGLILHSTVPAVIDEFLHEAPPKKQESQDSHCAVQTSICSLFLLWSFCICLFFADIAK